ncbi:hypothetical protein B0H19DRAFT_1268455 [Mycena capillaripes]|nr:hypothetical protein B0H19DRAFT_1268455 [Mycena capillaripes]
MALSRWTFMHMVLFPNVKKPHLHDMDLCNFGAFVNLLGACEQLKSLYFHSVTPDEEHSDPEEEEEWPQETPLDLTALEELVAVECGLQSQPKMLSFGDSLFEEPYSVLGTEKLLRFYASSLVNLRHSYMPTVNIFCKISEDYGDLAYATDERAVLDMFRALSTVMQGGVFHRRAQRRTASHHVDFSNRLAPGRRAGQLGGVAKSLDGILSWRTADSMKAVLTLKFPRLQRLAFHFCAPRDSEMHFRAALRKRMKRQLKDRLEQSVRIECFDEKYNLKPETEASDCESVKSNHDGSDEYPGRELTEADERPYRREMLAMLAECGIYSDEDSEEDW